MPIYEYQCPHCRKNFEEWLKSDDDASAHPCPTCGASSPRIISQSTFILKGGGWYVTEYGSHHAENEAAAETSAETSADTPKNSAAGADAEAPAAGKTTDGKAQNTVTSGDTRKTKNTSAAPAKGSAKAASSPRKTPPTKDASKAS